MYHRLYFMTDTKLSAMIAVGIIYQCVNAIGLGNTCKYWKNFKFIFFPGILERNWLDSGGKIKCVLWSSLEDLGIGFYFY